MILSSATQVMNLFTIAADWQDFFRKLEPWDAEIEQRLSALAGRGFPKRTLLSLLCPGRDTDVIAHIPDFLQGELSTFDSKHIYFSGCSRALAAEPSKGKNLYSQSKRAGPARDLVPPPGKAF